MHRSELCMSTLYLSLCKCRNLKMLLFLNKDKQVAKQLTYKDKDRQIDKQT